MIDVNVNLSRWPFRRLPGDEPADLVRNLRKRGVTRAWAGSFDGIFHKDITSANARLVKDCKTVGQGLLMPFGSINPKLPDWQSDLRRCREEYKMAGIRLHPNYHGYDLKDPAFAELLKLAAAAGLIVQLAARVEDERTQHPLMRVKSVDLNPLPALVKDEPKLRLVVLNWAPSAQLKQLSKMSTAGQVYFDISTQEGVGGVANLAEQVSAERVLFGSGYPWFIFESALLKVKESGLPDAQKKAILDENARRLVA